MKPIPDDVLKTAAGLMAMTTDRGCTPEEAATAVAKLITLAERHGVTLEDLRGNLADKPTAITWRPVPLGLGARRYGRRGVLFLAEAIAVGFETRLLRDKRAGRRGEVFIVCGFEADVVCAVFAYQTILPRLMRHAAEARVGRSLTSFLTGASAMIFTRLLAARRTVRDDGGAACTGIVLRDKKRTLIEQRLDALGVKTAEDKPLRVNERAFSVGVHAGAKVEIHKAVGQKAVA